MKTVVFTFGRMNVVTAGHELLVNKIVAVAKAHRAVPMVFLSHSQDKKKNPLPYLDKIRIVQKAFGRVVINSPARTAIEVLKTLDGRFENVIMVVGSDRVEEFDRLLNTYNGKEYAFANIIVMSAGERDPDADGVTGISASKMRQFAADNNLAQFKAGLPVKLQSDAASIMNLVRKNMGLTESVSLFNKIRRSLFNK